MNGRLNFYMLSWGHMLNKLANVPCHHEVVSLIVIYT